MKPKTLCVLIVCVLIVIVAYLLGLINGFTKDIILTVKPTSIIQITGFIILVIIINESRILIRRLDKERISLLMIVLFVLLMLSAYEVLFAFNYWFSLYGITGINIDDLEYNTKSVNPLTEEYFEPVNFNVLSKIYVFVFFIILYSIYIVFDEKREGIRFKMIKNGHKANRKKAV